MIEFILNNTVVNTDKPAGMPLIDFIRYESGLTGTKTGCREGDCGACIVLEGELKDNQPFYKTIVSCLTPLGNVQGKHIVTIEGLNFAELTPVQKAIVGHSGTQCGFCTPGFVISLTGFIISGDHSKPENILAAIDGNICRCTGYKSIGKAASDIYKLIPPENRNSISWLVSNKFLPPYFLEIQKKLSILNRVKITVLKKGTIIGGGTDLMVQKADEILESELFFPRVSSELNYILAINGQCRIGGSVTVSQLMESEIMVNSFPNLREHFKLISSTPVRNMATLAGNIMNASPIADLVIFFLALNATILLEDFDGNKRELMMKEFFTGYKKLSRKENEFIREVSFTLPQVIDRFNFEKISKRRYLDIASVNSAMLVRLTENRIEKIHLSAGGVAPIPLFLKETCRYLTGKTLCHEILIHAIKILLSEISPISDIRGTSVYKRLLLQQIFLAHFNELFPGLINTDLVNIINSNHEEQ